MIRLLVAFVVFFSCFYHTSCNSKKNESVHTTTPMIDTVPEYYIKNMVDSLTLGIETILSDSFYYPFRTNLPIGSEVRVQVCIPLSAFSFEEDVFYYDTIILSDSIFRVKFNGGIYFSHLVLQPALFPDSVFFSFFSQASSQYERNKGDLIWFVRPID